MNRPVALSPLALGSAPVDVHTCTSPEYYEKEKEHIFRRVWLNLGHVTDVPNLGDYQIKHIPTFGNEVILVRGEDSILRAFYNICTHRGNKLVREQPSGNTRGFSCGFHGWSYDTRGALRYVPDEEQFVNFNKSVGGLIPLAVDTWENFIFVYPGGINPPQSLAEWLGEVPGQLAGGPLSKLQLTAVYRAQVRVNWKVFFDAFSEAYHVVNIHQLSVADAFINKDNPYCHLTGVRLYSHHHMASVTAGNPDHKPTLAESLVAKYGGSKYGVPSTEIFHQLPTGLNPERHPAWAFDITNIFPNFAAHVGPDYCYTYNFWPTAPDRTEWEMRMYQMPPKNQAEVIARQYTAVVLRDTVREDVNTTEATQENLNSGFINRIFLSSEEMLLRHRYQVVEQMVSEGEENHA